MPRTKQSPFPAGPFTTANFAPDGGGIDFLGLRLVNLRLLGERLIPELNNATGDLGAFWIATWIPWKFRQLATTRDDFTNAHYLRFRRAIEVALAWCDRVGSPASNRFGAPFRGIGSQQNERITFPNQLSFEEVRRYDTTSLFAAPLYGPALRYLRLLADVWEGEGGGFTNIPIVGDDACTKQVVEWVEGILSQSPESSNVVSLNPSATDADALDIVGQAGLHRKHARSAPIALKKVFVAHLLDARSKAGAARLRTTQLLLETLSQTGASTTAELRHVWLTNLLGSGESLRLDDPEIEAHRRMWAIFLARQLQRYALELFFQVFERRLAQGANSLDEIVAPALTQWPEAPTDFAKVVETEAALIGAVGDMSALSVSWNEQVHPGHDSFDWNLEGEGVKRAFCALARWTLRISAWKDWLASHPELGWGGADRIGALWFLRWLDDRAHRPLSELLHDLFGELIFSQHLRIALGRFDSRRQKLRFLLSDRGLVLTGAARKKAGPDPVVMADRLDAFVSLLGDLDVLDIDKDSRLSSGALGLASRE